MNINTASVIEHDCGVDANISTIGGELGVLLACMIAYGKQTEHPLDQQEDIYDLLDVCIVRDAELRVVDLFGIHSIITSYFVAFVNRWC